MTVPQQPAPLQQHIKLEKVALQARLDISMGQEHFYPVIYQPSLVSPVQPVLKVPKVSWFTAVAQATPAEI